MSSGHYPALVTIADVASAKRTRSTASDRLPPPAAPGPSELPPEPPLPEIGKRVRRARKTLKLTQEQLGVKIGVDQSGVTRFERGERGLRTHNLLALFAKLAELGIDVDGYIIRGVGDPRRPNIGVLAENPQFAVQLRELADRLEKDRPLGGGTNDAPGAGDEDD